MTSHQVDADAPGAHARAVAVRSGHKRRTALAIATLAIAVALATGSVLLLNRTSGGLHVNGPVALFARTTYNDSTNASDASRFREISLGGNASPELVDSIHAADPHTTVVLYMAIVVQPANDTSYGAGNCFAYRSGLPHGGVPSSYFLHTSSGAAVQTAGTYWLDLSNPNVQRGCANAMISQARRAHADGTALDLVNTTLDDGGTPSCPGGSDACATNAGYQAAMTSFLTYTARQLHRDGLLYFLNIGHGSVTNSSGQTFWSQWTSIADGSEEESFAFGTDHQPIPASQVADELANNTWSETHGKYVFLNADLPQNNTTDTDYALALMLMTADGHSIWNISEGCYTGCDNWLPAYTAAEKLGAPLGPYKLHGTTYSRRFQGGTVTADVSTHAGTIP